MELIKKKKALATEENNVFIYPSKIESSKKISPFLVLIRTLQNLVEEEDYNEFMAIYSNNFYEGNREFLESLNQISEDLEKLWNIINIFLNLHGLGYSEIVINLNSKKIEIHHFESPFVNLTESVNVKKTCKFMEVFYSKILSNIFDESIILKEVKCANEKDTDYCIFSMV